MSNYNEQIIDHFTHPRNMRRLLRPDVQAEAVNPCCGDRLNLYANVVNGRIAKCTFLAYGCAAAIAVGSLLTEALAGKHIDELIGFREEEVAKLAGGLDPGQRHCAALGEEGLRRLVRNYRAVRPKGALR
jgi:nitrogen fixation NifU-like protein